MFGGSARVVGGRYRLSGWLGRGGMGAVWEAHDTLLGRDVALKEIHLPEDGGGPADPGDPMVRRAFREARAAARLRHRGIVTIHDVVTEGGRPWIVMELVDGPSLAAAVRVQGTLTEQRAADIGLQVVDALRAAHRQGVLHRDVKPANILLGTDRVVLTDFGIAAIDDATSITSTGQMVGSPAFLAPERFNGQPATAATDLWSLGVTLYIAVTGRSPFPGEDLPGTLAAILHRSPEPPAEASALWPVIAGLLAKDPAGRLTADQAHTLLTAVVRAHDEPSRTGAVRRTEATRRDGGQLQPTAVPDGDQPPTTPDDSRPHPATVPDGERPEPATVPDSRPPKTATVPDSRNPQTATVPDGRHPQTVTVPDGRHPQTVTVPDGRHPQTVTVPDREQPRPTAAAPDEEHPQTATISERERPLSATVPEGERLLTGEPTATGDADGRHELSPAPVTPAPAVSDPAAVVPASSRARPAGTMPDSDPRSAEPPIAGPAVATPPRDEPASTVPRTDGPPAGGGRRPPAQRPGGEGVVAPGHPPPVRPAAGHTGNPAGWLDPAAERGGRPFPWQGFWTVVLVVSTVIAAWAIVRTAWREWDRSSAPIVDGDAMSPSPSPSPSGPRDAIPAAFLGAWSGTAKQPIGVVESWRVTITFTASSRTGGFDTSLSCDGTLTVIEPWPTEGEIHLRQKTGSNPRGTCVDAAEVTLRIGGEGRMEMVWQDLGEPLNIATASLTRA